MSNLQVVQNKVSVVSKFLFGKETNIPSTIKDCELKLNRYYRFYGENYFSVCAKTGVKLKLVIK